ncbi:MAG: hypothetical protein HOV66_06880 [Streptomycetaceae bacterium]|nr:hypothetical protein [Streptomycetaceae bacterium]
MVDSATDPSGSGSGSSDGRTQLVAAKIEHAWGSSVGEKGYGAPDEVAERLYDALYHPERVVQGIQERLPEGSRAPELRVSTRAALEARVDMGPAPDRSEFVRTVSDTIVRGVPVAQTLLSGAREALAELSRRGVGVMAWSAGEPKHQHHKLADVGIVDPAVAPNIEPPIAVSRDFGPPLEVATAIAPDKTVPENMQQVARFAGGRHLVVADDRTKNVVAFQQHFPGATGLWIQYGAHAAKSVAKLERGEDPAVAQAIEDGSIVPVREIGDLVPTIEQLQRDGRLPENAQLALASDVDDTLLDNDKRRDLQHAATLDAVQSRGWAAEPTADAPRPEPTSAVRTGLTTESAAPSAEPRAAAEPTAGRPARSPREAPAPVSSTAPSLDGKPEASTAKVSPLPTADIVASSLPSAAALARSTHAARHVNVGSPATPPAVPHVGAHQDKGLGFKVGQEL